MVPGGRRVAVLVIRHLSGMRVGRRPPCRSERGRGPKPHRRPGRGSCDPRRASTGTRQVTAGVGQCRQPFVDGRRCQGRAAGRVSVGRGGAALDGGDGNDTLGPIDLEEQPSVADTAAPLGRRDGQLPDVAAKRIIAHVEQGSCEPILVGSRHARQRLSCGLGENDSPAHAAPLPRARRRRGRRRVRPPRWPPAPVGSAARRRRECPRVPWP